MDLKEIEKELVNLSSNMTDNSSLTIYRHPKSNISLVQHYNSTVDEVIEFSNKNLNLDYDLYISSSALPLLAFSNKFKAETEQEINGIYLAGYLNCDGQAPVSVYVSPTLQDEIIVKWKGVGEDKHRDFLNIKVM